jgi:uncharacterized protein (TIGR02646 family)
MIRVVKPITPVVLSTKGTTERQNHRDEYDAAPDEYRSGTRTFTFADSIYAADEVKDALRKAQKSKCAFCESLFTHIEYGDIEHFRPKGGYKQHESEKNLKYPGYYWLAYEWSNLFYSCQLCNQRFKRNLFPLRDNRSRAKPHKRDVSKEKPLLIDPAQDPSAYIGFRDEYAFAVKGCREGATTIDVLGLNREELAEYRRKRLQDLRILRELCAALREILTTSPSPTRRAQLQEYETELQERTKDEAEYAAMARAFLNSP